MSNPTFPKRTSLHALDAPAEDDAPAPLFQLSPEDQALLTRARAQHAELRAPSAARERLLTRALEEVDRPASPPVPARELISVPQRGAHAVWLGGALALGVLALGLGRGLFSGPSADVAPEPSRSGS